MVHVDIMGALTVGRAVTDIGRSFREAFYMFWDTLWALVLGFGLSGAVQAFVSRDEMRARMGNHGPKAITRAGFYGAVSSSCSYAAAAMARSMFARGADFLAAMVFMFASTNLVFELGIVLVVLIGWQFVAAEFVGGVIMIALLVAVGGLWFRGRVLDEARNTAAGATDAHHHGETEDPGLQRLPWKRRVRSKAGWSDAAGYTMSDLSMLRKEMVIGFLVAGFLTILVPNSAWNAIFIHGHGFATTLENVILGPLVAILSFVCSIGNVPLAAALWKGGIGFGGVVSFIFADLITLPLLLIYRKQYGRRMTVRMLGVFWLVMSTAGLVTEELFKALGWIPHTRPTVIAGDSLGLNYTTVLDIIALVVFGILYWLYRNRDRFGGGVGYAKDPVCGMQIDTRHAPASVIQNGKRVYFCSEGCCDRFDQDPNSQPISAASDGGVPTAVTDPVCGMTVNPTEAAARRHAKGQDHWFCSAGCADAFDGNHPQAQAMRGNRSVRSFLRTPHR
ncbi:MAG: permease [Actinomycetota bacterium]|nr:permease [Actinomycetota bacterium]